MDLILVLHVGLLGYVSLGSEDVIFHDSLFSPFVFHGSSHVCCSVCYCSCCIMITTYNVIVLMFT